MEKERGWRGKLRRNDLPEGMFTRLVRDAITDLVPGSDVKRIGDLELEVSLTARTKVKLSLHNLLAALPEEHEERIAAVEHFLIGLAEADAADGTTSLSVDAIVPIIKDTRFFEEVARQAGSDHGPLLSEALVADLHVLYGMDRGNTIHPLVEDQLAIIGFPRESLRQVAVQNLRRLLPPIESQQNEVGGMIVCGGTYEASVLLLDKVWEQIERDYSGPIIASAPARDMLLYGNSKDPRALDMICRIAEEVEQGGAYLISRTILIRREGQWHEFERRD